MTVSTNTNKVSYAGNDSTTVFALGAGFIFFEQTELEVTLTVDATGVSTILVLTTEYTVAGGSGATGTVTTVTAPATGETLTIRRVMPLTQLADLVNNDTQDAEVVEDMIDKNTLGLQQMDEELDRVVKVPVEETGNLTLPSAVLRRNKFLFFEDTEAAEPTAVSAIDDVTVPLNDLLEAMRQSTAAPAADKLPYLIGSNDADITDFPAFGRTLIANTTAPLARADLVAARADANDGLTMLLNGNDWPSIYKGGWKPAFHNQQWGGARWGGMPDGSKAEAATGYIVSTGSLAVADNAARTYQAQGFKVGETTSPPAVWVKLSKTGNPQNNLTCEIWDQSSGDPNAVVANGAATAQDGVSHPATEGWVRFVFATAPALSADTAYYIVLQSSGAVDAANYWLWHGNAAGNYPHGNAEAGDGTPTWTAAAAHDFAFLVEDSAPLLSSGSLVFAEGAPLEQSKGLVKPLKDFYQNKLGTILIRGSGFAADKTILDAQYGIDHDRIVLRCNVTTGYAQVDFYESDESLHTITGTTDISSGTHDVAVRWRAEADGSDYLYLDVDGTTEGTDLTSQTFTLDPLMEQLGHVTVGGGMPLAPTWDENEDMSALPSAGSWTWTGTATEAAAMVSDGTQLFQNASGYGSTQSGYYQVTTTLDNSVGWTVATMLQVDSSTGTVSEGGSRVLIEDGSKTLQLLIHGAHVEVYDGSTMAFVQQDMTDRAHTIVLTGKGSDFYLYIDGELRVDGTGLLDAVSATNGIIWGDSSTTAAENSGVIWQYVKYYDAAWTPYEGTAATVTEFVNWQADKDTLLDDISGSTIKSISGVRNNYITAVTSQYAARGITSSPTTTATTATPLAEMSAFGFGMKLDAHFVYNGSSSTTGQLNSDIYVDGTATGVMIITGPSAGFTAVSPVNQLGLKVASGMHYVDGRWYTNAGTTTALTTGRTLFVEAK